jgi:hypothetical protein
MLQERINDAREELRERVKNEQIDVEEPHDTIHEIADSSVPVYTYDIVQCAAEDISLATDEPD